MNSADVSIESIAAGGDGIARANGVVVFVPRGAPGDVVRVAIDERKRFARGTIETILTPSPDRVDPLCYHYRMDKCGGCQLQHLNYDAQVRAKQVIIRDSLTRIGKRSVDLPSVEGSPIQWRYRRKLTLAIRRARRAGDWVIGLHRYDDPVGIFQLADCPITDERVLRVWRQIMEARQHFPPGDELRAAVQLLEDGASVVMEGANAWPARSEFFDAVPLATSVWWRPAHRARMLVAERGRTFGEASFAQVNAAVGARLHEYVLERARHHRPSRVVDAYAGAGATAIPLAADGAHVTAIELDRDAVARCAALLPEGSEAIAARVEDVIARVLPADVVLINPPRTGVHETVAHVMESLDTPPRALIYVSCDPATLARDLTRMPRYRIESLRAFDMFPQTAHVETVCELVPATAAA
ncbi:MAG TPA: TRAM domain-containing protein [Gemmatimonadaceae bacterium]|nr:TRAM domain-containing protein [Gemmatimonadaceae bacterium]